MGKNWAAIRCMACVGVAGLGVWGTSAALPAAPPSLALVRDGQPQAVVVLPDQAPPELKHAAEELVGHVRRISGASLRIASQAEAGPAVLLEIDRSLNPPAAGRRDWAGARGYRLRCDGNRLCVTGGDALGVLQGVYGLLERHLDVRWLWPGELGDVLPSSKTLQVGPLDEIAAPDFAVRWVGSGDWALRHGANAMVQIGRQTVGVKWKWHFHTFVTLIPAEKYYDQHPDWWPLVNKKRQKPTQPHSHSTQLCTTNPEMVAEMTRNLLAVLDEEPDLDVIALSPNDGGGFCECPRCCALDEPGRGWFARYSKRLATLNNQIAAAVAPKHPNVLIKVGAYAMYLRRPLGEELAPTKNQLVQMCHIYCCHNHPLEGDRCVAGRTYQTSDKFMTNVEFRRMIEDWKRVTDHLFIYEYYTLGGPSKAGLLWPMAHTIRADMPYYRQVGAEGFYTQLTDEMFYRYGLNYYLAAKLAWNTRLDVDALTDDYCRHAFGPAAGPMLAYFQRLEKAMVDSDLCLSYGLEAPQRWGPNVFTAQVLGEAQALLEKAVAAAPEGACRQRVALFRKGFDETQQAVAKMKPAAK